MIVFACDQITTTATYDDFRDGKGDGNYVHNDRRSSQQGSRGGGCIGISRAGRRVWLVSRSPAGAKGARASPAVCVLLLRARSSLFPFSSNASSQEDSMRKKQQAASSVVRRYTREYVSASTYFLAFSAYITASPNLIKSCKTFFGFRYCIYEYR